MWLLAIMEQSKDRKSNEVPGVHVSLALVILWVFKDY